MVANILSRQTDIKSWDEVLGKIEEIANVSVKYDEISYSGDGYIYEYISSEFCRFYDIQNLDNFVWIEMAKTGKSTIQKINPEQIIHIQSSVDVEGVLNLYRIVENGLWDDNFGSYPDTIYIPSLDKYLVYDGNHRTTLFYGLEKSLNCTVWENKFLSDILDLAVKSY